MHRLTVLLPVQQIRRTMHHLHYTLRPDFHPLPLRPPFTHHRPHLFLILFIHHPCHLFTLPPLLDKLHSGEVEPYERFLPFERCAEMCTQVEQLCSESSGG